MKQTLLIGIFIISTLNTFSQNNELLGTFKIVFIGETIENTKHKAVFSGITLKAEHLAKAYSIDIECLEYSPNTVYFKNQTDALSKAFFSNADAIIICPNSVENISPILDLYQESNKEIVFIENTIPDLSEALLSISSDEYKAGALMAQAMLKKLPTKGRVAILTKENPSQIYQERLNGLKDALGYKRIEKIVFTKSSYHSAIEKIQETMHADENNLIKGWIFLDDWALRGLPKFPWQAGEMPIVSMQSSPISYLSYDLNFVKTFIIHPYFQWGAISCETLINKIFNNKLPESNEFKTQPIIVNWENIHALRREWESWLN